MSVALVPPTSRGSRWPPRCWTVTSTSSTTLQTTITAISPTTEPRDRRTRVSVRSSNALASRARALAKRSSPCGDRRLHGRDVPVQRQCAYAPTCAPRHARSWRGEGLSHQAVAALLAAMAYRLRPTFCIDRVARRPMAPASCEQGAATSSASASPPGRPLRSGSRRSHVWSDVAAVMAVTLRFKCHQSSSACVFVRPQVTSRQSSRRRQRCYIRERARRRSRRLSAMSSFMLARGGRASEWSQGDPATVSHQGGASSTPELVAEVAHREVASWPLDVPFALHPRLRALTLEIILRTIFGASGRSRTSASMRCAIVC